MWVSHGLGPPQVKVYILEAIPTIWFFFWFRFFHEAQERCARIWRSIPPRVFYGHPPPKMSWATACVRIPVRPPPWCETYSKIFHQKFWKDASTPRSSSLASQLCHSCCENPDRFEEQGQYHFCHTQQFYPSCSRFYNLTETNRHRWVLAPPPIPVWPPIWFTIRTFGVSSSQIDLFDPDPGRPSCA